MKVILSPIIQEIEIKKVIGSTEISLCGSAFDSRNVVPDTRFIAVKGTQTDGYDYITGAIESGAKAVVCEHLPENQAEKITYIQVPDSAKALAFLASAW